MPDEKPTREVDEPGLRELAGVISALKVSIDEMRVASGRDSAAIRESVRSLANRVGHLERRVDALERQGSEPPPPADRKQRIEHALDELRAAVAELETEG